MIQLYVIHFNPEIQFLVIDPGKILYFVYKETHKRMFIATLFTISEKN